MTTAHPRLSLTPSAPVARSYVMTLKHVAEMVVVVAYLLLVVGVIGGLVVIFATRVNLGSDYRPVYEYPNLSLGIAMIASSLVSCLMMRFVAAFGEAWAAARLHDLAD